MYYYIYEIKNIINNMIYIGAHKTNCKYDSYMGSGVDIKQDIDRYGKENFRKRILFEFDNEQDMFKKESEIVNENFVKRNDTYNKMIGGFGSWNAANRKQDNIQRLNASKIGCDNIKKNSHSYINKLKESRKIKDIIYQNDSEYQKYKSHHLSHPHTKESKRKISEANKGRKSSTEGLHWITSNDYNSYKLVSSQQINDFLSNGWLIGKIPKNTITYNENGKTITVNKNEYLKKIKEDNKKKQEQEKKKEFLRLRIIYTNMYKDYLEHDFNYVKEKYNYTFSREALIDKFKKYVIEYDSKVLYEKYKNNKPKDIFFKIPQGKTKQETYTEMYNFYRQYNFDEMCIKYNYNKSKNSFLSMCKLYVRNYIGKKRKNKNYLNGETQHDN